MFKNLLLLLLSLTAGFAMCEVGIRIIYGNNIPFKYPQVKHLPTEWGYKLVPNQTGSYTLDQEVRTNSYGFRDNEWAEPKPEEQLRIMILGDSLTFGNAVGNEDTYAQQLEGMLKKKYGDVEVMNVSAGGWATYHEVDYFTTEGYKHKPDIVILGFYLNDYGFRPENPTPNLTEDGRADARPSWIQWLPYKWIFVLKRSALVTFMRDIYGAYQTDGGPPELMIQNQFDMDQKYIHATYELIKGLKTKCKEQGIPLIIAHIPSIGQFRAKAEKMDYVVELKKFADENDINFLNLDEDIKGEEDFLKLYLYPWDNHLSRAGHEVMAKQLYRYLEKNYIK